MINERKTNPVIANKLSGLIESKSWNDMEVYLLSLSNSYFRSVGHILANDIMLRLTGEDFWELFSRLSLFRPKAFLGTCLKAAIIQYKNSKISVDSEILRKYAETVNEKGMNIDRDKFLASMLTALQNYEEFDMLFAYFGIAQGKDRIRYLLHCSTASAYHSLFRNLKYIQDDIEFMQKCCYVLIRKDDRLSYNMASILCKYFDIPNVRGVFSLNIEPFQLNYLDSSQQAFTKVLISV